MARIILTGGTEVKVRKTLDELHHILDSNVYGDYIKLVQYQYENSNVTDSEVLINIKKIKLILK